MPSTSTPSSNLDDATIQVAEMLSNAAYDSLSDLSSDTNIQQLEAQGWNPVPIQPHQTDSTDSYQGIAFYKTINGVVQVVIANRGTVPASIDDLTMDYDIAHNIQPPSDSSAQAFYQDVVSYFTNQHITNINVIETGHSLGGQEADYVATRGNPPAPTEAVTFDAPGIGPAAQSASSANAVNISNADDVIHEFGGTYVGNETTVSAPAPTSIDSAVGRALGIPLGGMSMLVGGMLGNVMANHGLNDIAGYLSADPALAGVDLSIYSADQINQAVVNALAAMTRSQYYAMSSVQRANFLEGVFSQYGSTGSNSGSLSTTDIQEAFTVVSSGPDAQTLTGSVGDSVTLSFSGNALTSTASNGYTDTESFDATTGALTSDTWKNAIGTKGAVTYAADGSSKGTVTYADGNYATTLDDGQGNITTDYYTKDGVEIRSAWVHSDGSSGTVSMHGDGLTVAPGGGAFPVPKTSAVVVQNPDGSYVAYGWNAEDIAIATNYNSSGSVTGQSSVTGPGANDLTVVSSTTAYNSALQEELTEQYSSAGALIGNTWYAANPDGSANPNGVYVGWAQITALNGTEVDNASGVVVKTVTALDGTQYRGTVEQQGDTITHLSADGTLLGDTWTLTDGADTTPSVTGSDTFNADGSGFGSFSDARDGSAGTVTVTSAGDITVVNTNSSGVVISEDIYNVSTGNYEIATFNTNGTTLNAYQYLPNGDVEVTDYAPDGVTVADQETVAAGLVVNPDGSDFSKIVNADNSYTVYFQNASGDMTAYQYSASGQLTGSYHTTSYDTPSSDWSGTLSDSTTWTGSHNAYTPTYTDAQGNAWTLYLNANGQETGADWINAGTGTHGYGTFNADGSQYDVTYNADGSFVTVSYDGEGGAIQETFDTSGNEVGDAWRNADGSYGADTFKADGSSSGGIVNANGSYSNYTDDGQGNFSMTDFSAAGGMLSEEWAKADGTYGNETFNANDSTVALEYAADGSYTVTDSDGQGDITQIDYSSTGVETGDVWQKADGSYGSDTYNADGSSSSYTVNADGSLILTTVTADGQTTVDTYSASGVLLSETTTNTGGTNPVKVVNADGSYSITTTTTSGTTVDDYSADGVLQSETKTNTDGSSVSMTYNADGSSSSTAYNADGSYSTSATTTKGNTTVDNYDASGVLLNDSWAKANGNSGTDTYNADGSVSVSTWLNANGGSGNTTYNADGSYVTSATTAVGNATVDNYDASGVLLSDSWSNANGNSGTDTYNADGSVAESTWLNANGSSGNTIYNADGSYSVSDTTAKGNTAVDNYDASGTLISDSWINANGNSGTDAYVNGVVASDTWADAGGTTGSDTYNASGALIYSEWTNTDGSWGSNTYDGNGTVTMTTATDASGNETIQTPVGTNTIDLTNNPIVLTNSGATDTVDLGASVNPDQLWFLQSGSNLVVSVLGSNESLTIQNWYDGASNQAAAFVAGNGQALVSGDVDQLVQAMAAFSPPTASQTAYTPSEANAINPVIASTWH